MVISISDDGRGVDPDLVRQKSISKGLASAEEVAQLTDEEVVRLIALPGFSTVVFTATEISGQGRRRLMWQKRGFETLGGTFRIQSKKGQGTTFILRFPLTLAIIKALLVKCDQEIFAIPVINIVETLDVFPGDTKLIQQQETIVLRGDVITTLSHCRNCWTCPFLPPLRPRVSKRFSLWRLAIHVWGCGLMRYWDNKRSPSNRWTGF